MTLQPPGFHSKQPEPQWRAYFSMLFSDVAKEDNGGGEKRDLPEPRRTMNWEAPLGSRTRAQSKNSPHPRGPLPCNPIETAELQWISDCCIISIFSLSKWETSYPVPLPPLYVGHVGANNLVCYFLSVWIKRSHLRARALNLKCDWMTL